MATNNEAPERTALRQKIQRLQTRYNSLIEQQKNTQGVFSGQQLSGGLAPASLQTTNAKKALEAAEAELVQYDVSHPLRG